MPADMGGQWTLLYLDIIKDRVRHEAGWRKDTKYMQAEVVRNKTKFSPAIGRFFLFASVWRVPTCPQWMNHCWTCGCQCMSCHNSWLCRICVVQKYQTENFSICRVSKSWNHAITQLRKIFENLCTLWTNNRETGKTDTIFMYRSQFDKVFPVSHVFLNSYFRAKFKVKEFWVSKRISFLKVWAYAVSIIDHLKSIPWIPVHTMSSLYSIWYLASMLFMGYLLIQGNIWVPSVHAIHGVPIDTG